MSIEAVLDLFDSWFRQPISSLLFCPSTPTTKPSSSSSSSPLPPSSPIKPSHQNDGGDEEDDFQRLLDANKLLRAPTLQVRFMSDQLLAVNFAEPFSPDSVLVSSPKLQTILSGREFSDFVYDDVAEREGERISDREVSRNNDIIDGSEKKDETRERTRRCRSGRRARNEGLKSRKSLSELEFEELKGFMDLGFVFSEQDKDDSDLVSILPGLQRLGMKDLIDNDEDGEEEEQDEVEEEEEEEKVAAVDGKKKKYKMVRRPYLSEAWDVYNLRKKKTYDPLMNWRVPALGNETTMKAHLRFWAHAVASAVR